MGLYFTRTFQAKGCFKTKRFEDKNRSFIAMEKNQGKLLMGVLANIR